MSTTKSGGKARQGTPRSGRRLGVKIADGQTVKSGQVIIRQIGSTFHSGSGTGLGRDFTIFALKSGVVKFFQKSGTKVVEVN